MISIRSLTKSRFVLRTNTRAFHSPFKVSANSSPLTSEPPSHQSYEKQTEHSPTPTVTHSGTQSYVVSEPDPESVHYSIPTGAYSATSPYEDFEKVPYKGIEDKQMSSTSSDLAHPNLTNRMPKNESGVGSSASVRFAQAPGKMEAGSHGGLHLMDKEGTDWEDGLPEKNPGPTDSDEIVQRNSRLGLKEAWKERK